MKTFFSFFFSFFSFTVMSLEPCPEDPEAEWHNCEGSYQYSSGETYSGAWKNNLFHGKGIFLYENGDRYIGYFKKDVPHGEGTYQYKNGDLYVGEWNQGKRHGKGSYAHSVGQWETDLYQSLYLNIISLLWIQNVVAFEDLNIIL